MEMQRVDHARTADHMLIYKYSTLPHFRRAPPRLSFAKTDDFFFWEEGREEDKDGIHNRKSLAGSRNFLWDWVLCTVESLLWNKLFSFHSVVKKKLEVQAPSTWKTLLTALILWWNVGTSWRAYYFWMSAIILIYLPGISKRWGGILRSARISTSSVLP